MKKIIYLICLLICVQFAAAEDFKRNLPDEKLLNQLQGDKFKDFDAVVILKEQSWNVEPSLFNYRGVDYKDGISSTHAFIRIVKVFNDAGVKRYGSFEDTYREYFADEFPSAFAARARVLKPDGTVIEMPKEDIKNIVERAGRDGTPESRKVIFKIPDLAAGDVVQLEYELNQMFITYFGGIFYYNEPDPVLFSNLYLTLPKDYKPHFISFPENQIGQPKSSNISKSYGAGATYFWSVRNLNKIPKEPYAHPFSDQSLLTTFYVDKESDFSGYKTQLTWDVIAEDYFSKYMENDDVKEKRINEIGFSDEEKNITFGKIDSLYTALRKTISLKENNSLYPRSKDIDWIFEKKKGDASDLAYIMYNILKQWEQPASVVWLRDKREGMYEVTVPLSTWFDRIGVLVKIGERERLYDFDRSVAMNYEYPSYLKSIQAEILNEKGCSHTVIKPESQSDNGYIHEKHLLELKEDSHILDTMQLAYKGMVAEEIRSDIYDLSEEEINNKLRNTATEHCFNAADTIIHGNMLEFPELTWQCVGTKKGKIETLDKFYSLKLENQALKSFREKVFSAKRHNDLYFYEPFSIAVEWNIHLPKGYSLKSGIENRVFPGPQNILADVSSSINGELLIVKANVNVSKVDVPYTDYSSFMKTLDSIVNALDQEIVLNKQ